MSNAKGRRWTREELILAINLYCKTPFGKIHNRNPEIIELAKLLGRTPSSISYKLANFASIDTSLPRKGASNVSKLDKEVWNDFFADWGRMAFESEKKAQEIRGKGLDALEEFEPPEGKTREATVRVRVNQSFFRKMILSSYDVKCCITGMPIKELLVASHIVPWSSDIENRLNPQNGLCLNALHDKAFDVGLITIDKSYCVVVASKIEGVMEEQSKILTQYEGVKINMPSRFAPSQQFLGYHRENVFKG